MRRPEGAAVNSSPLTALLITLAFSGAASAQDREHEVSLDIYAFSQGDDGGDPFRSEGFDYFAWALEMKFTLSEVFRLNMVGTLGYILGDPVATLPETVDNRALLTSASEELLTLDAAATLEIAPKGLGWRFSPSFYYHHQHGYVVLGGDLGARGELAGGDTVLSASYGFRHVRPVEASWDGTFPPRDRLITHNLLLGWTQTLSPAWIAAVGLQYTRQDGLLHSTLQYVALFDDAGAPATLVDEVLPRTRNRGQLNLRVRWSPRVGLSVGLAGSFYLDDWGVVHGAVQPSVEFPVTERVRWRFWYRLSIQDGTEHHESQPTVAAEYRTADSDLLGFLMHSPGTAVTIPIGGVQLFWTLRASAYGFYRSDSVYGGGGSLGVVAAW